MLIFHLENHMKEQKRGNTEGLPNGVIYPG